MNDLDRLTARQAAYDEALDRAEQQLCALTRDLEDRRTLRKAIDDAAAARRLPRARR